MSDEHISPAGQPDGMALPGAMSALSGRISSWRDFADRVSAAMALAAADPVDITLSDPDFVPWPLGLRSVTEAFQQWGLGARGTSCHVLAVTFDEFVRVHPRWVSWRATWAHRVHCRQPPDDLATSVQTLLLLHGRLGLRMLEPLTGVGVWTRDPVTLKEWLSEVDVIWQQSHDALPPTTLGL